MLCVNMQDRPALLPIAFDHLVQRTIPANARGKVQIELTRPLSTCGNFETTGGMQR